MTTDEAPGQALVRILDVSGHQHEINWNAVAASVEPVISGVFVKVTEGATGPGSTDEWGPQHARGARAVGLPVGLYHFLSALSEPEAQAAHFIAVYRSLADALAGGRLAHVLDVERGASGKIPPGDFALRWLRVVAAELGEEAMLYTAAWVTTAKGPVVKDAPPPPPPMAEQPELAKYRLWVPAYITAKSPPDCPPWGPNDWTGWQFENAARVAGVTSGIDLSFFRGLPAPRLYRQRVSSFDRIFARMKVTATSLGATTKAVVATLTGYNFGVQTAGTGMETCEGVSMLGSCGLVVRPRAPDSTGAADTICARTDDGVVIIGSTDRRLTKIRGNLAEGSISLVGYGGAFTSIDDANSGASSSWVTYVPYGAAPNTKAHTLTADTTNGNESVSIVHGLGHGLLLTKDGHAVLKNKAGDAFISAEDDGIVITGQIKASTSLVAGDIAAASGALIGDFATGVWVNQVNAALAALHAGAGGLVPPITAPTGGPTVASNLKGT